MLSNDPGGAERGSIVEATFACLAEPHDGPIPVAAILSRAGVSSRAFYRHFQSKDELFLAMLDDVTERLAVLLDAIAAGAGIAPLDRLRAWLDQMFTLAMCGVSGHRNRVSQDIGIALCASFSWCRRLAWSSPL